MQHDKIAIIGVGGGGSHLAYFMSKVYSEVIILDYDKVEAKNLRRQLYSEDDVGKYKVEALKKMLGKYSPFCKVTAINRMVENKLSFADIDKDILCIAATDNLKTKKIMQQYFNDVITVGCEADYFEVTSEKDRHAKTWELATGYETNQNFTTNITSAAYLVFLIQVYQQGLLDKIPTIKFNLKEEPIWQAELKDDQKSERKKKK